jgi:transcription elongation factor GreA
MSTRRTIQLTAEGITRLQDELHQLESELLPELKGRIQQATEDGDVNDNTEFDDLKEEFMQTEARIREIEQTLERAEVIAEGSVDGIVALGSHVTVRADDGEQETWVLVNAAEADALDGRISADSPLGRALVGNRAGDATAVETPDGPITYTVVDVR